MHLSSKRDAMNAWSDRLKENYFLLKRNFTLV